MKTYLKIQSKGEIEVEALSLMGASTKKNDSNTIGKYGSGGKYSISALIRNKVDFKIFSGSNPVLIETQDTSFRGQNFQKIIINGNSTSLTTSMGGDEWDGAFAPIREIYSNALDEDENTILEETDSIEGRVGYTTYFLEMTEGIRDFKENIFNYFCVKNPNVIFSNKQLSAYPNPKGTLRLFRKGILCKDDDKVYSLYQYNSPEFKINESRVLSDTWEARYTIAGGWKACKDKDAIMELINYIKGGNSGKYEHDLIWGHANTFSEEWHEILKDKTLVGVEHTMMFSPDQLNGAIQLQFDLIKRLKSQFKDLNVLGLSGGSDSVYSEQLNPSEILQNKVIEAIGKLLDSDYRHRWDNPVIKYVRFSKDSKLGEYRDNSILLSVKLDTFSVDEIAKIIIEENEHGITGFGDETRCFQNHLFSMYYDQLTRNLKTA